MIQVDKILKVIEQDATMRFAYWERSTGRACAIGGLAQAAGFDMAKFTAAVNAQAIGFVIGTSAGVELGALLFNEYGLRFEHLDALQKVNDRCVGVDFRRSELAIKVRSLATAETLATQEAQ